VTAAGGPAAGPIPDWPGQQISLGGYQVYVRSVPGEPDHREPALCVHGLAGSSRNWTDLMDLLRPVLACEAVDLPGFGDSAPRPDGRYSIGAFAQTVTALIQRRGRGQVHLIANSMGGAVAVKVAAAYPELVCTLTLISPALPESRVRRDMIWFPLMSLPRVGPRLLRRYEVLPPENRVADVITTCYSDPGRFPQARFATEVAELTRRDTLGWAPDALQGSVRALTAEFLRRSAWREAAKMTASLTRGRPAGPRTRLPTAGWWCCRTPATSRRWSSRPKSPPRSACCSGRPEYGNSRSRQPVDAQVGPGAGKPGR
jgi:pimeloyl-ACP methyl ester carboxylesterase